MTKEDMILYAEFMAGCDVNETPMSGFFPEALMSCEAAEVWSCGLIMKHNGKEVCVLPDKSKGLNIRTFVWLDEEVLEGDEDYENGFKVFGEYDWKPTDEELVAELKKQKFWAPWVGPGELKYIILKKFPDALKEK